MSKKSPDSPLWIDDNNMRILRGDPVPEDMPPNPLDYAWQNTGPPIVVFRPLESEDGDLDWTIKGKEPSAYYSDDGQTISMATEALGESYSVLDPPIDASALAFFEYDGKVIGRFVGFDVEDELIKKWTDEGVEIVVT